MNATKLHCSPYNHVKFAIKDGTCYSIQNLRDIAKEYNKLVPSSQKISLKQTKDQLHDALEKAFSDVCEHELCWTNNKLIRNGDLHNKLQSAFRPEKPLEWYDNPRTWLNTYDILFVMEQYETLYKDFKFLGVHPMDFAGKYHGKQKVGNCVNDILCNFNIKDEKFAGKKRFAFVINTDYSSRPGQHWVSIFFCLDKKYKNYGIFYYDSVASPAVDEIKHFMNTIKEQVDMDKEQEHKEFIIKYNKIQKQRKDTECGVFSMVFITQCLKDVPFDFICQHMKTDDEINIIRNRVFYSPNKKKI